MCMRVAGLFNVVVLVGMAVNSALGQSANADLQFQQIKKPNDIGFTEPFSLYPLASDPLLGGRDDLEFCVGTTVPGETPWQDYRSDDGQLLGIYADVDTSIAGFTATPRYFTCLAGTSAHWTIVGATSIYNPTPTGFRVCVRYANGHVPTPAYANSKNWHICWLGVRNHERVGSTVPGTTPWREYRSQSGQRLGLYVDVDTTAAGLSGDTRYLTSLGGDEGHVGLVGATSIYIPTDTGFRIYLKFAAPVMGDRAVSGEPVSGDESLEGELGRIQPVWPGGQPPTFSPSPTPEYANEMKWHVNWFGGSWQHTTPGATAWQEYRDPDGHLQGIYVDVDLAKWGYENSPYLFTSLGGIGEHWSTVGATSLYGLTPRGFRIYLKYASGVAPTPEVANERQWHISWLAVPAWPPTIPELTLTDRTKTTITARVVDKSSNEFGFELQRRLGSGGNWQVVTTFPPIPGTGYVFSYTNEGLLPDTLYCYRVRVHNYWGQGFSPERCVRTLPEEVPLPDVAVGPLRLDYQSDPGDPAHRLLAGVPFTIIIPFTNQGNAPMPPFKLSYQGKYSFQDTWQWYLEYTYPATLEPGKDGEFWIYEGWGFPGGEWDIRIVLDSDYAVTESRENNNTALYSFTVYWLRERGDP